MQLPLAVRTVTVILIANWGGAGVGGENCKTDLFDLMT